MRKFNVLLVLHLCAIHSSIAAMELFSWLLFALFALDLIRKRERPLALGCDLWIWGFALIATAGLLYNFALAPVGPQIGFLRFIFLIYSFAYAWSQSEFLRNPSKLTKIWFFVAALIGTYAFLQFLTGINLARPHKLLDPAGSHFRATGMFSQSLTLAYVLGVSGAFLLPQLDRASLKVRSVLMALIALGLFASLSRAAWFAFAITGFVFAYQKRGRRAFWLVLPVGIIFGLLFAFESEFRWRILNLFDFSTGNSTGMRRDIWMGYWQIFLDHPLLGIGLFNGDEVLPDVFRRLGIVQPFVSHAHNNFLQALAGTGSFGFLCFIAFQFYFLKLARDLYRNLGPSPVGRLAQGAFLAQVFWTIGGLTECNFFDGEVNHAIIFLWGLVIAIREKSRETRQ